MTRPNINPETPPKNPPHRVFFYLPFALFIMGFLFLALVPPMTSRWLDFPVYWEAGEKALRGVSVYDVAGHFQYKYSPLVALLFGWTLGSSSFATASFIFQKTMLMIWFGLFLRLSRSRGRALLFGILFFGNAIRLDLELGQINALVLALLVFLFTSLDRPPSPRENLRFGLVFSFVVQLKLFALILIPYLAFRREWKKLALGLVLIPILSVGGIAVAHGWNFAIAENIAWLASLRESTDALLISEQNVGALGTFAKSFGLPIGKVLWVVSGLAYLAYLWRNRDRPTYWFKNNLLHAIALFNPLVWSYWILYALPVFLSRYSDFEGAFRRRSIQSRLFFIFAGIFIFIAFNGQHARWAWNGGIFIGLLLLGLASSKVRTRT